MSKLIVDHIDFQMICIDIQKPHSNTPRCMLFYSRDIIMFNPHYLWAILKLVWPTWLFFTSIFKWFGISVGHVKMVSYQQNHKWRGVQDDMFQISMDIWSQQVALSNAHWGQHGCHMTYEQDYTLIDIIRHVILNTKYLIMPNDFSAMHTDGTILDIYWLTSHVSKWP